MTRTIFLAGATGAVGSRLVPMLRAAGFAVVGTTRSPAKARALEAAGAVPVVVDVFDGGALTEAVVRARPEVAIHQLTDLPPGLDPSRMAEAIGRNARVRIEGTRNLVAACVASGVRRLIAQSIAWAYAPGPQPYGEDDPLDAAAEGPRGVTVGGVIALERATLGAPSLDGVVLRYGQLYGPGTGSGAEHAQPRGSAPVHVDAAARAALLAIDHGRPGIYNIAEPTGVVAIDKARQQLGWDPGVRDDR